tara:strand:+ start:3879 stop:4355 length:477 start_codon:yes stop_codon:yes gene_type:complete
MPLNPMTLKNGLLDVCKRAESGEDVSFVDMVDAIEKYALDLQYPPPVGVSAAAAAMKGTLAGITHQMGPQAAGMIGSAFIQFGTAVAAGMPIGGSAVFPTMPPPGPPNLASAFSGPQDAQLFATKFSTIVDAWMRTGMYDAFGVITPTGPVPGPSPWM